MLPRNRFFRHTMSITPDEQKKDLLFSKQILFSGCRERDSNPHSCNSQGILSPSCLPFHHRGRPKSQNSGAKVVQIERNTKQKTIFFVFISEMQPTFDVSQSYVIDLSLCTFRSKNKWAKNQRKMQFFFYFNSMLVPSSHRKHSYIEAKSCHPRPPKYCRYQGNRYDCTCHKSPAEHFSFPSSWGVVSHN